MNDFTILHLSDLHINTKTGHLSLLMQNLLDDIRKELKDAKNIVVVVTGDLVHKNDYGSEESVVSFFEHLHGIIAGSFEQIYIVPGNHDKVRNILDKDIADRYRTDGKSFYSELWKYVKLAFDEYTELCKRIYTIFYGSERAAKIVLQETYGVRVDTIAGKRIGFLMFNTAWSCKGKDERRLSIGEFQVEKMKELYSEKCQDVSLTIALAHHPLNWLKGKEEDMLRQELLSKNGIKSDVYMCGHIHDRDAISWQNNRCSLVTLVSGIGWPDGSEDHPYTHTYSIYGFNLDANTISANVRSTDDTSNFEPDFRIYGECREIEDNRIIMPIRLREAQAYFKLGVAMGQGMIGCSITENMLNIIQKCVIVFLNAEDKVHQRLELLKHDVFNAIVAGRVANKVTKNDIKLMIDFLFNNQGKCPRILKNKRYVGLYEKDFHVFLQMICLFFAEEFIRVFSEKDERQNQEPMIKIYFRMLKIEAHKEAIFVRYCVAGTNQEEQEIAPVAWGGLIKASYKKKRPLIASVNRACCSMPSEKPQEKEGEDFITVVPQFYENKYVTVDKMTGKVSRELPIVTFGVTVYEEQKRAILYALDCLRIDQVIGKMLRQFLRYFPLNLCKCIAKK